MTSLDPTGGPSPKRLTLALFSLSFATVLFTLAAWKLLAFFIMPSLFFDLLFVGFPVGAFLGARYFRLDLASFQKSLVLLQAVMIVTVFASLSCKHFDYLRAHLFEVELGRLILQMGTFTALFVPFFCMYGLSEYLGYQLGLRAMRHRMRTVYALYLFGAASAYVSVELALHRFHAVGVSQILVVSVALVCGASALVAPTVRARRIFSLEAVLLVLLGTIPAFGFEERFLDWYKGAGMQSTKEFVDRGYEIKFQRWGRYSLTEILRRDASREQAGFYNDLFQWEYSQGTGFNARMIGAVPLELVPDDGAIAIIGSGGGRQVQWAKRSGRRYRKIRAIELEPAVIEGVTEGGLASAFDDVYGGGENVELHRGEARGFMESTEEQFDLIFLPSVGGYPQMMLEPGNMIRTIDAYRTLRDRLTDQGILAIWYPSGLDPKEILTRQYVRSLGDQGLGLRARAYRAFGSPPGEYLILAAKSDSTPLPTAEDLESYLRAESGVLPPDRNTRVQELVVVADPEFRPITDEQPFLAGNVRHIFSMEQLYSLFAIACGTLLVIGALLAWGLRRSGDPRIAGRSYAQVAVLSFLIGANFVLFEHYLILALFKKLYVFHDALVLGAISFLVVSGLGSVVIAPRLRVPLQLLACALVVGIHFAQESLSPTAMIVLVSPVAFVTGSFFPALFERSARNPLAVFAFDAIGAGLGSTCSFFLPIAFGFRHFFAVAGLVFLVTAFSTWRFFRGLEPSAAVEETELHAEREA